MKRPYHFILLTALIPLLHACGNGEKKKPESASSLNVDVFVTERLAFNNEIITTAELLAGEQLEIMSPLAAQVLSIHFREGQKVQKGSLLVHLDDRAWKAQLSGLRANLANAEKDLKRKKDLLEVGGSSQEEIDNAASAIESLRSQIETLEVNISLANITAPFSGQLGMRDFSVGAFLKQGDPVTTLTDNEELKVDFTVAQSNQNSVSPGKKIQVIISDDTMQAEIYAINPQIHTNSRTLEVRARLEMKKGEHIMPGSFARVLLSSNFIPDAILVPTQAVIPSINEQNVYVIKNGKAAKRVVEMGNRSADMVHIASGLESGDSVICTGLLQIKDGMQINTLKTLK